MDVFTSHLCTGSGQEGHPASLPGDSVAAALQCPESAHKGPVLRTAEDDVTLREADPQRHRPHIPRARVLQGEGQPGPGSALQRHEGVFSSTFLLFNDNLLIQTFTALEPAAFCCHFWSQKPINILQLAIQRHVNEVTVNAKCLTSECKPASTYQRNYRKQDVANDFNRNMFYVFCNHVRDAPELILVLRYFF